MTETPNQHQADDALSHPPAPRHVDGSRDAAEVHNAPEGRGDRIFAASRRAALLILLLAAAWRIAIAWNIPCVARDSVTFCWHARAFGEQGLQYLRNTQAQQHPLFPLAVLGAQRAALALGAPDTPLTWQRSGQATSILAGLAVVALVGLIARRMARLLQLELPPGLIGNAAMLIAALLPANVWLSAEVMSDQLHLALYLLGAWALLRPEHWPSVLLCGLAGGSAFLTRPEGVVIALAGGVAVLGTRLRWTQRLTRAAGLAVMFLTCALPYWYLTGTLSPKKNPLDWLRAPETALSASAAPVRACAPATRLTAPWHAGEVPRRVPHALARLELRGLSWGLIAPYAFYMLLRGGMYVVPIVALPPLVMRRRELMRTPLLGGTAAAVGHFTLTLLLLAKYDYLAPRHMLVIVMLLTPWAAVSLAWLYVQARRPRGGWAGAALAACLLPLAVYSLRLPNAADRFLVAAAAELRRVDPRIDEKTIMSGSSQKRVAFYTGAEWIYWYEAPDQYEPLVEQLLRNRPDYFLLESGVAFERSGNAEAIALLKQDARVAPFLVRHDSLPIDEHAALHLLNFNWGGSAP